MKLRHPLSRALYSRREDGLVCVDDGAKQGLFHPDGRWHAGELREADPHMVGWVAGSPTSASEAAVDTPEPVPRETGRGLPYQKLLDTDSRPVPDVLRLESADEPPVSRVPIERYVSPGFHALEMERMWKRVWQMACREEEIPEVGDHVLYEIGDLSLIVVRSEPDRIRALHNVCRHRGRPLRDEDGRVSQLRCPFHGWVYGLDGALRARPCEWDFDETPKTALALPEARVGTWGGFIFVNPDPEAEPLESWLGELPSHFARWPLEERYKQAHVAKVLDCNWKVAQEAFMEAYHVVATHPQLLPGIGDANSQYDAWQTFSRAITPNMTPSPHLGWQASEQDMLDSMFSRSLDAEPALEVPEGSSARETLAQMSRAGLRGLVPAADELCDAELADSFYYTLFPNLHPWGAYNRLVYRFRPFRNEVHRSVMEVMHLSPFEGERPPPAKLHWLADDEDWTCAPELGFLTRVFNQDTANLARVQRGLRGAAHRDVVFARYQETKIRHFHALLERFVAGEGS